MSLKQCIYVLKTLNLNMKLIGLSLSCIWLIVMAAKFAATARHDDSNAPVLDTAGKPLRRGVEYFIYPAASESGGPFTLIDRDGSCPFYVGQRNVTADGIPVTFAPYVEGDNVVRKLKNFKVAFSGATSCVQSTTWKVGGFDAVSGRRLIGTGDVAAPGFDNYFYISTFQEFDNIYTLEWCPAELCPTCFFICGSVGLLFENGQRLFALDGNGSGFPFTGTFPVVFERANNMKFHDV